MWRKASIPKLVAFMSQATLPRESQMLLLTPCKGCQQRNLMTSKKPGRVRLLSLTPLISKWPSRLLAAEGSDQTKNSAKGEPPESTSATKSAAPTKSKKEVDISVKVQPTLKTKKTERQKTDFSKIYQDNIYMTPTRAMNEYLLKPGDFEEIKTTKRRSPFPEKEEITVFLRRDVERKSLEVWGSKENLQKERDKILQKQREVNMYFVNVKKASREYEKQHAGTQEEKAFVFSGFDKSTQSIFKTGSGKVVVYAITINSVNCLFKFVAWLYSGSHSMFAEFIHSMADTINQIILAIGLHQSIKGADLEHPYGWSNFGNVASLISGVGIFCLGAGLSIYHGVLGLVHPGQVESMYWAISILGGSFISEGATLLVAINQVRNQAEKENMSFMDFVWRGMEPSTNVVLLEDLAAVLGVTIAASCMGITYYIGNPMADAIGSLIIGSLLAVVASFIIYTNTIVLVGRSIPMDKKVKLMRELEDDRMIRALHDVKATDMGGSYVRFKAEVDFDGQEISRLYLERQDLETLLAEMNKLVTIDQVESFMLKHGERIVDTLGSEVDRIEKNLKKKHPEIRHVDLEQL